MSEQMKITKKCKFIPTHTHKKTWHILIGISLNEQKIKNNKEEKPFQYAHIWNIGFIDENNKSKYSILYTGVLTNKSQKIYIHVINFKDIIESANMRNLYFFNKNAGNDIWECLYFSNEFQEYKNKYIFTKDCKVKMKNIFYALIGSQYE
jgi:hypothetical protein